MLFFIFFSLTLGIAYIVWFHRFSARIGSELTCRGIPNCFGAETYWLWSVLGSIIVVWPFVYLHKLSKAMNLLAENYNSKG